MGLIPWYNPGLCCQFCENRLGNIPPWWHFCWPACTLIPTGGPNAFWPDSYWSDILILRTAYSVICALYSILCTLYSAVLCRTIPYHTIPYHTIPYHTIPYHTIPYHTIPCHTMPYHTMLYYTINYTINFTGGSWNVSSLRSIILFLFILSLIRVHTYFIHSWPTPPSPYKYLKA